MSQFSEDDMKVLETMVFQNFEDSMMINSLAKLQHAHITMTERLNNIFSQSISKLAGKQTRKESDLIK